MVTLPACKSYAQALVLAKPKKESRPSIRRPTTNSPPLNLLLRAGFNDFESSRLEELPTELQQQILDFLPNADNFNVAQACPTLVACAQRVIFSGPVLCVQDKYADFELKRVHLLLRTISLRPGLGSHISSLRLNIPEHNLYPQAPRGHVSWEYMSMLGSNSRFGGLEELMGVLSRDFLSDWTELMAPIILLLVPGLRYLQVTTPYGSRQGCKSPVSSWNSEEGIPTGDAWKSDAPRKWVDTILKVVIRENRLPRLDTLHLETFPRPGAGKVRSPTRLHEYHALSTLPQLRTFSTNDHLLERPQSQLVPDTSIMELTTLNVSVVEHGSKALRKEARQRGLRMTPDPLQGLIRRCPKLTTLTWNPLCGLDYLDSNQRKIHILEPIASTLTSLTLQESAGLHYTHDLNLSMMTVLEHLEIGYNHIYAQALEWGDRLDCSSSLPPSLPSSLKRLTIRNVHVATFRIDEDSFSIKNNTAKYCVLWMLRGIAQTRKDRLPLLDKVTMDVRAESLKPLTTRHMMNCLELELGLKRLLKTEWPVEVKLEINWPKVVR